MTDADFRTNTFFYCHPASMNQPTIPLLTRAAHLTQGIPALTPAVGATAWGGEEFGVDMKNLNDTSESGISRPNGWPVRSKYPSRWLHSDIKDVPYFYTYKFFETIIEKGGLR